MSRTAAAANGGPRPTGTRPKRRPRWRRIAIIGGGVALAAVTFLYALPKFADYGAVWGAIRDLTWLQLLTLAGATAVNILTYAPPLMAGLPGIPFRSALAVTLASTASTYVAPGGAGVGLAVSFGMLRAWGFGASDVGLAVAVTGVWNQFFLLGAPAVALALLTLTGDEHAAVQSVALIGLAVFILALAAFAGALWSPRFALAVGNGAARLTSWGLRLIRRRPARWSGRSLVGFRARTIGLLRRRWWHLTLATVAGQLTVFLVLLVALRALGVSSGEVSFIEAFGAWSLVRLLGSLPITPGGIG
ncbi:MAG TPA: lysylphosphatidylglycerol synthase domain-containing protein, partial [Solirubrobacteraceae bacterium]